MWFQVAASLLLAQACVGVIYDSYSGEPASEEKIKYFKSKDLLSKCTNDIKPCDMKEPRRLDGTCINPNFPAIGGYHVPLRRVLEPVYKPGTADSPRLSKSGKPLPNERLVRKRTLLEGKISDPEFTQLLAHASTNIFADTGSVHDSLNYLHETPNCCEPEGKNNHMCTPIPVFNTDSTHKFTDVRCLNLTRPKSFQSYGCAAADTTLTRYEMNTSPLDLSFLYRPTEPVPDARLGEKGLLKFDVEDGSTWPPTDGPFNYTCFHNVKEFNETKCFGVVSPSILAVNVLTVILYRCHNLIATELAELNPHWDDDKIFSTTREILIAFNNQLTYYELMPELLGRENILRTGLISNYEGHRSVFDPKINSQASLDFMMGLRSFHTMQEGDMNMYDENNQFWKSEPIVNHSLRIGYFRKDHNFAGILRGSFLQAGAKHDNVVDEHIAETGLGNMQRSSDLTAADLKKCRLFGFRPYVDYLQHCGYGKPKTWTELARHLGWEFTEILKELYEDPYDVDLIVGMWGEDQVKGGYLPKTVACLVDDQLQHAMRGDRHWYEDPNRPNAFTLDQLKKIRQVSYASMICAIENKIKTITRWPLRRVSPWNPLVSCNKIPRWDLSPWKEDASQSDC